VWVTDAGSKVFTLALPTDADEIARLVSD
jgi:hypothetical protein